MRGSSRRRLIVAIVLSCGLAPSARAGQSAAAAPVSEIPLPGGVAGLMRAAGLQPSSDPVAALHAFVRVVHGGRNGPPDVVIRYLEAVSRLSAATAKLPNHEVSIPPVGMPMAAVREWVAAAGLSVADGRVVEDGHAESARRRQVLEQAGVPVAGWVEALGAGRSIQVRIPSDTVPLPLSPDLWGSAILGRDVPPGQLAGAILADRRAALVYHGLMALDDETLLYLGGRPSLLSDIAERGAGAFGRWGRSIRVRNGQVQVPGGPRAAASWAKVVGQAPADPQRFIRALVSRDAGRAAYLYDVVAHLDPVRQAFALGDAREVDRAARFHALYGTFAGTAALDTRGDWPVVRHPVDPGAVLAQVAAAEGGRMAQPSSLAMWEAVFGAGARGCSSAGGRSGEVDAAWLVDRIEREFPERRAEWLGAVAFAQRVFGRARPSDLPAVCEAVASFRSHQALLLALERMRMDDPSDYVAAVRFAERTWTGADRRAAIVRTAQAQGILVTLERAFSARTIDSATARRLVLSLSALATEPVAQPSGAIAAWMRATLLPALCGPQLGGEACLVRAVSGQGLPGNGSGVVTWEDERYRVDLGAATATRVERIRASQRGATIDEALALIVAAATLADRGASVEDIERQAAVVAAVSLNPNLDRPDVFGHGRPDLRARLRAARSQLASAGAAERAEAASSLAEAGDLLLAEALVSFAYAVAIGDPEDAVLMAGDPSRQHQFDATLGPATAPWHLPEEVQAPDGSWLTEGAAIGLHVVFARSWLRRLSMQDPGMRPRPDPQDVRAFGESQALFNAFDLTDGGRDAIVGAIRRGRTRLAELLRSPDRFWNAAADAGIGEWRRRATLWAAGRPETSGVDGGKVPAPADYLALSELMWLGGPDLPTAELDHWGVSARTMDGRPTPRMPRGHAWEDFEGPRGMGLLPAWMADVPLRAAEMLAALELPAALAPGLTSYVAWDVMTSAEMAHPDDWLAVVRATRALPEDRTFDYVSTLTAIGPLVPAK
jgi:hypothetical protein